MAIKTNAAIICSCLLLLSAPNLLAQDDAVYCKDAIQQNRVTLHQNIIRHSIIKNISLPLTDTTEENWEEALGTIELLQYRTAYTDKRVRYAFTTLAKRSNDFK